MKGCMTLLWTVALIFIYVNGIAICIVNEWWLGLFFVVFTGPVGGLVAWFVAAML